MFKKKYNFCLFFLPSKIKICQFSFYVPLPFMYLAKNHTSNNGQGVVWGNIASLGFVVVVVDDGVAHPFFPLLYLKEERQRYTPPPPHKKKKKEEEKYTPRYRVGWF